MLKPGFWPHISCSRYLLLDFALLSLRIVVENEAPALVKLHAYSLLSDLARYGSQVSFWVSYDRVLLSQRGRCDWYRWPGERGACGSGCLSGALDHLALRAGLLPATRLPGPERSS